MDNDEKFQQQMYNLLSSICLLLLIINTTVVNGVLCPNGCNCENEILKANCSGAGLEVVPIQLNPELERMDLSRNKIKKLFYMFNCYEKLLNLDVSQNRIEAIENGDFKTQKVLQYLNLSNNNLITLEKATFEGLIALTHLDLSNNKLKSLNSNAFQDLSHLTVLLLNENNLDYFNDDTFKPIPHLQHLNLNDNSFLDIPLILTELTKLNSLSIARNLIEIIEDNKMPNLSNLSKLELQENLIIDIQAAGFANIPNLDHLDLSDNNLTMIPTNPLSKLRQLVNLKLNGNSFNRISAVAFRGLFDLKYLSLNRLELLETIDSRAFVDNINLEKISLDYNYKIKNLPTRLFAGNHKLKYISLRYNSIEFLVANHFPLDQLMELKLGGNPFDCNCSMGWLWLTLQESKMKHTNQTNLQLKPTTTSLKHFDNLMLDFNDVTCDMPEELHDKRLINVSQRQMDCSMSWLAITSVSLTVLFILSIIAGVLVFMPKKRHKNSNLDKHIPPSPLQTQTSKLIQTTHYNVVPPPPPPLPPPRKCLTINRNHPLIQQHHYNHHNRHLSNERYIIPPIMIHGQTTPGNIQPQPATELLWNNSYEQEKLANNFCIGNNIYEQLNDHLHHHRDRPHIVYV